jgi:hypothetical protein
MQEQPIVRRQRILVPHPGVDPIIGRALAAIDESRARTVRTLDGLTDQSLDHTLDCVPNSIGTLLYHIAAIELDYLQADVLEGAPLPDALWALFPIDVRDEQGRLSVVRSVSLDQHLSRLAAVRQALIDVYSGLTVEDFFRPRVLPDYDITPEWVIHHLIQHEAEHRIHIEILTEHQPR